MNTESESTFLNQRIREYLLTDIVGTGGMGTVYKGYHVHLKTARAIKVLKPQYAQDKQFKDRFEREARILARLENRNVIRIYEFFEEQNHLFLVMEYAPGESLSDKIEYQEIIPVDRAVAWLDQACSGLAHAHAMGIVHRDLSPDNLIITDHPDGEIVRIIDFGIAKTVLDDGKTLVENDNLTTPGIFIGKIRYCSPEQAAGREIDHRSDQYSLALILYEAITGVTAFQGETPMESLTMRLHEPPPKLSEVRPGSAYPSELEGVIDRALEKKPDNRFPDILAFQEALQRALSKDTMTEIRAVPDLTSSAEFPEIEGEDSDLEEYSEPIPLGDDPGPATENSVTESTVLRSVPGLTNIQEDFKEASSQPSWITPSDGVPGPRRRVQAIHLVKPKRRFAKWVFILFVLLLFVSIGAAGYLWRTSPDKMVEFGDQFTAYAGSVKEWATSKFESQSAPVATPVKSVKMVPYRPKSKRQSRSTPAVIGTGPFLAGERGVVKPVAKSNPLPHVPDGIQSVSFPVTVTVELIVLKTGKIGVVDLQKPIHPSLDQEIIKTLKTWEFIPGTKYGQPADIILDYRFELDE